MNEQNEDLTIESPRRLTDGMSPQELQTYNAKTEAMFEEFKQQLIESNRVEAERIAKWKGEA